MFLVRGGRSHRLLLTACRYVILSRCLGDVRGPLSAGGPSPGSTAREGASPEVGASYLSNSTLRIVSFELLLIFRNRIRVTYLQIVSFKRAPRAPRPSSSASAAPATTARASGGSGPQAAPGTAPPNPRRVGAVVELCPLHLCSLHAEM
jgi:hypothetical protein